LRTLKFSLIYFSLVFLAGFVLGTVRVLWIVPQVGQRYAELMELPIMLLVVFYAARFVVLRMQSADPGNCLYMGLLALCILLGIEFTLVLGIQGLSIAQSLANRDPVSGAAYALSLLFYALMPSVIAFSRQRK
jgi:hypothetical protein